MKRKGDWTVTSFIGILVVACALAGSCHAATYESMESYEDLLRSQTVLISNFENLLKNSTLAGSDFNYQYQFLDSFDDLADRQQQGLASFEDLVSYNWSDLEDGQKINLTQSFEDLIRREAIVLSSNEDLLKRGYCNVSPSQKQELLDRFDARLKYEYVLYTKFQDWLIFQQAIQTDPELSETWIGFQDSLQDLISRQARLVESFGILLKLRCDDRYLALTKTISGDSYSYTLIAGSDTAIEGIKVANVSINDSLLGFVDQGITLSNVSPSDIVLKGPLPTTCDDCDNCRCNVCNFATACGDVVTPDGNFTVCVVSNQVCVMVDDFTSPAPDPEDIHPGIDIDESAMQDGEGIKEKDERNVGPAKNAGQKASSCPTCPKNK